MANTATPERQIVVFNQWIERVDRSVVIPMDTTGLFPNDARMLSEYDDFIRALKYGNRPAATFFIPVIPQDLAPTIILRGTEIGYSTFVAMQAATNCRQGDRLRLIRTYDGLPKGMDSFISDQQDKDIRIITPDHIRTEILN